MSKQLGRAGGALDAITRGGADGYVAVDMACARPIVAGGHRLGNLGHLVQIARAETSEAAGMAPEYWTIFSRAKATEASKAVARLGRTQEVLLRVWNDGDTFYPGHEGGFHIDDLPSAIAFVNGLEGLRFADGARIEVNAPGTTSTAVLDLLADIGGTQVEPGHGLTGSTPLHAVEELPEQPAALYLTEVAHLHQGVPLCFGGGFYVDPVFDAYDTRALVAAAPEEASTEPAPLDMPDPAGIDYYARLHPPASRAVAEGDTVICGFRVQAFVTRACVVGVAGVGTAAPAVAGVWNTLGDPMPEREG